jgi:hypothetical protein
MLVIGLNIGAMAAIVMLANSHTLVPLLSASL